MPVVMRHFDYLNRTDPCGVYATRAQPRWLSTPTQLITARSCGMGDEQGFVFCSTVTSGCVGLNFLRVARS